MQISMRLKKEAGEGSEGRSILLAVRRLSVRHSALDGGVHSIDGEARGMYIYMLRMNLMIWLIDIQ